MLSNSMHLFQIICEYSKYASTFSGFIFLQEIHSTIQDEKKGTTSLRRNSFSYTIKAILAESLYLVSQAIRVFKCQIKNKMNLAEFLFRCKS